MFLFVEINFGNYHPEYFSESRKFSREISVVEFCYSSAIVFIFNCYFTYVSETYDFIELYHDLWRFILDLADPGLFSTICQFNIYITAALKGGRNYWVRA